MFEKSDEQTRTSQIESDNEVISISSGSEDLTVEFDISKMSGVVMLGS